MQFPGKVRIDLMVDENGVLKYAFAGAATQQAQPAQFLSMTTFKSPTLFSSLRALTTCTRGHVHLPISISSYMQIIHFLVIKNRDSGFFQTNDFKKIFFYFLVKMSGVQETPPWNFLTIITFMTWLHMTWYKIALISRYITKSFFYNFIKSHISFQRYIKSERHRQYVETMINWLIDYVFITYSSLKR